MIYRLDNDYHTQRNNRVSPSSTCQTTAAIMALKATGIPFESPSGIQPEDHLAKILDTQEAWEKLRSEHPALARAGRPPREVHALLSWAINDRFIRSRISIFTTRASIQELLFRIARHRAASLVTGSFTPDGHVVTLVGFESEEPDLAAVASPSLISLAAVSRVIIDDPWGNWTTGYRSQDGNDVSLPIALFDELTREYGEPRKKWAHLFSRDGNF